MCSPPRMLTAWQWLTVKLWQWWLEIAIWDNALCVLTSKLQHKINFLVEFHMLSAIAMSQLLGWYWNVLWNPVTPCVVAIGSVFDWISDEFDGWIMGNLDMLWWGLGIDMLWLWTFHKPSGFYDCFFWLVKQAINPMMAISFKGYIRQYEIE